jgi:hypothetical protein
VSEVNLYFNEYVKEIATDSRAVVRGAAEELCQDVQRQIRRNFRNPSIAFQKGLKLDHYENASYVRLSPILSAHAQETTISGSPERWSVPPSEGGRIGKANLWILLPDGVRLGFKRMGKGFNWTDLKRRFGTRLSFVPVEKGHVVLFRDRSGVFPIYKIQPQVQTKQRIEFFETAQAIADERGLEISEQK